MRRSIIPLLLAFAAPPLVPALALCPNGYGMLRAVHTPRCAAVSAKLSKEEQLKRRKAGLDALKSMASIYRERAKLKDAAPKAKAAAPPPPPPATPTTTTATEDTTSPGLIDTLTALAAAKVELSLLRQRDRVLDAPSYFLNGVQSKLERQKSDLDRQLDSVKRQIDE